MSGAALKEVYLSHSARETYTTCPRQYWYKYIQRLSTKQVSCNLGFGNAVHAACAAYLFALISGKPVDPIGVFTWAWKKFQRKNDVDYGAKWTPEQLQKTGEALVQAFVDWWPTSGYTIILDVHGKPVVERRLRMRLPGNVIFTTVNDILALSPEGKVVILDIKTPAQLAIEGFALLNEQLLGYQVSGDAFAEELGIERVDQMGFLELHKVTVKDPPKKAGAKQPLQPRVIEPELADRRSDEDVADWMRETMAIANDIRNGRFPRRPGDSFSSACKMCSFYQACSRSDMTGLYVREKRSIDTKNNAAMSSVA